MTVRRYFVIVSSVVLLLLAAPALHARAGDRVQFGSNIDVRDNEDAGSLVCIGCSIHVAGSSGDVVAIGGSVLIDGTVKGDVVTVGGSTRLGDAAQISGDATTIGGPMYREPGAVIKGDVTSQGAGAGWLVLLLLVIVPLLPVIAIVAFVWWLVSRNRGPVPARA